jgi:pimeloyl-ACP methyl ester carboxylesterase
MNTPHERLTRTTFSLPLGEVHALPLLFLHGFPDHPPTAVPFLEHLAETHRVVAPWLRGYAPSPIVGPYDLETLAADALVGVALALPACCLGCPCRFSATPPEKWTA